MMKKWISGKKYFLYNKESSQFLGGFFCHQHMSKASNHKTTLGKEEIIHFEKHPTGEKTLLRHFDAGEIPEFFDDTKPFRTPPKNNHSI